MSMQEQKLLVPLLGTEATTAINGDKNATSQPHLSVLSSVFIKIVKIYKHWLVMSHLFVCQWQFHFWNFQIMYFLKFLAGSSTTITLFVLGYHTKAVDGKPIMVLQRVSSCLPTKSVIKTYVFSSYFPQQVYKVYIYYSCPHAWDF